MNFEKSVPFDPGYSEIAFSFANEINFLTQTFYKLKNPNQKRFELMKIEKGVINIINKATAFYLGCMLWGAFIHYRFKDSPKKIEGNNVIDLTDEEKRSVDCACVVKDMLEYIKIFDKDCKYFLKRSANIEKRIFDILDNYIEFAQINNNFLDTSSTSDVKIPKYFCSLEKLSNNDLDALCNNIYNIIESKDIGKILEIRY